jgi:hypothetical protein
MAARILGPLTSKEARARLAHFRRSIDAKTPAEYDAVMAAAAAAEDELNEY